MNKLFTKIAGLALGLTMTIGVGVALANNQISETKAAEGDVTITFAQSDVGSFYESSTTSTTEHVFTVSTINFGITGAKTKSSSSATSDYGYIMMMGGQIYNKTAPSSMYVSSVAVKYTSNTGTKGKIIGTFGSSILSTRVTTGTYYSPTKGGTKTFSNSNTSFAYFNISNQATDNTQIDTVTVVFKATSSDASPKIDGLSSDVLYRPGENLSLSYSWSSGTKPATESPLWSSNSSYATFNNSASATPVLTISDDLSEKVEITISLKINNNSAYSDSITINAAPHLLTELTISSSVTKDFKVDDTFTLGAPTITAKYVDGQDEKLQASDLSFKIGSEDINLGDKMVLGYNGKTVTASYTDGVTKSASYTITVTEKVMPTPIFEGGWNKVTANDLSVGDQIVLGGSEQGFVGDGNDSHKDWFVMSTNQKTNNRGTIAAEFNDDQSKILSLPEDAQLLTVVAGNKEGTIALSTGSGYLAACSSSSNNLHTDSNLSDESSFSYNIVSGVCTFTAQGEYTRNIMQFNIGNKSQAPVFSMYASASQKGICVYRNSVVDTDKAYVQQWINDYLHFQDISTSEVGTGLCQSSGWYTAAKEALLETNATHSTTTNAIIRALVNSENTEFNEAVCRYEAWALANNDSQPYGDTGINPVTISNSINTPFMPNGEFNEAAVLIIAISSLVALSVIGGYFLLRKRKHQ